MKSLALLPMILFPLGLFGAAPLHAHGGQYRGPGDTVPPGGTGTPGPGGVGAPSVPGGTGTSSPSTGGSGPLGRGGTGGVNAPSGSSTGFGDPGLDLTQWSFWWEFNKDAYLNLKDRIVDSGTITGSDGWFLGLGEKSQTRDSLAPTDEQIRSLVVPTLLAALEHETNNDIVTGCLIALAKIGDAPSESQASPFAERIAAFLPDKNQEISETAAVALGILGQPAAIKPLCELLKDSVEGRRLVARHEVPVRTRAFAAYGLGQIGARTADEARRLEIAQALHAQLEQGEGSSRDLPVACLIAFGLTPLATIESPAEAPQEFSRSTQIEYLLAFLADPARHRLVRAHVPGAIAHLLDGELPDELRTRLRSRILQSLLERVDPRAKEAYEVLQSVALALGQLATTDLHDPLERRTLETLVELTREGDTQTRYFALIGLAQVGARWPSEERASEEGLELITRTLLRNLGESKGVMPSWAALACGVLGHGLASSPQAVNRIAALQSAVRAVLEETRSPERLGACMVAAGLLGDLDASDELLRRLATQKDDGSRGYAALGLGLMDAREALGEVQTVVAESKYRPDLLKQAAIALGLMGDKKAAELLASQLATAQGLATQASLSSALGFIGDRRSIDPLVAMLKDTDLTARARGFAAAALGIVGDRSRLPWNSLISRNLNYRASTSTLTDAGTGTGILDLL